MPASRIASAVLRLVTLGSICLILFTARTASAGPFIYFYEGNALETSGVYACPPVCNLSGWFLMDSALAPNLALEPTVTPLWFNFTNGLETFTPLTTFETGGATFRFDTDVNGEIEEWMIQLVLETNGTYFQTWHTPSGYMTPFATRDWTFASGCSGEPLVCGPLGAGVVDNDPGAWTAVPFSGESPVPVPEPGTLLLMGSGLVIAARKARGRESSASQ